MIGQTISHYRITEKLGAGGMGVVFKAVDLQLERTVALKFLPQEAAANASDKEILLREARSASALDHPNIGSIYGLEESGEYLFIVMAFYEGQTLAQKIATTTLSVREALDLALQIASGLAAAHARNIVHRDIKPSNILITNDGVAKIVDFGLARVIASSSATQTINTSGTLPYMAPEQILGERVDCRADVWAFGIVLVQILTGSHPFLRENVTGTSFAILNQPPVAIDAVPPSLQPLCYRALSKDPAHRYPSAKELLPELETARAQLTSSSASAASELTAMQSSISARELRKIASRASAPRWVPAQETRSKPFLYLSVAVGILLLAGLASLAVPSVRQKVSFLLGSSTQKHIAVLPFDNIGNDPANEPVAQGLMESLASQLSNLDVGKQSLWVVPASVVRSHKITDPAAALGDLGANLVVKGAIQRQDKNIRLTVNLIETQTLRQVGSASLEDATGDLARLQDEAVSRIAGMMRITVTPEMLRDTGGKVVPSAYESYLKALGLIQRYDKPGNLDQAIAELDSAIQTDPRFAVGYAERAEAYRLKNQVDPNPKWAAQVSANCSSSQKLDDRLPACYVTLGRLHSALSQNDLALQEFQKALAINPRDPQATTGVAFAYERMGRIPDAEAGFKRAIALRPDYWDGYNSLGMFYSRQNRDKEAIEPFQRVIQLTPDNPVAYSNLASAYVNIGDPSLQAAAESALKKSISLGPSYAAYANLGVLYLNEKKYREAADTITKALELNDKDYLVWDDLRVVYEWLGDTQRAQNALERTLALLVPYEANHPQEAGAQSLLAKLYAVRKEKAEALRRINSALQLAPNDPDILGDVAEAYESLDDRPKSTQYAQQSLKSGEKLADLQTRFALQPLFADPNFRVSGKN